MELDKTTGPSPVPFHAVSSSRSRTADARNQAGVVNTGYWGMAARGNDTLSVFLLCKEPTQDSRVRSPHVW